MSFNRNLLRYFILISFFFLIALSWQSQADAGQLQLAWTDNANNEDGFKIERKLGTTGTFSQIATMGVNVTSHTDTNLTDGATYCYRLRAFNSAGSSAYSPEGCATVKSTLSITKIGSGTVTSSPAGISCGSDCNESYLSGTVVALVATPAAGFVFGGWSGSGCSTGSVTMNASKTCTATFNAVTQTFTLSVNLVKAITSGGTGNGTVTSNPAGINCGSDCSEAYASATVVALSATPAVGSIFSGWSGSGCSTGSVAMNGNKTCTATFNAQAAQTFGLSINKTGTGSGTVTSNPTGINCGSDCSESYSSGAMVVLSAIPATGSVFSGWSGSGCSTGSVTMSASRSCTAVFSQVGQEISWIGIFRPSIGGWYLDRNGNQQWDGCGTDVCVGFGIVGDIPVVGDWTGTGQANMGVYRNGGWALDLNGNDQWDGCGIDGCLGFGGVVGDIPLVGDWTGSGTAKIGVFRDGNWALDLNGNGQWDGCGIDGCFGFGGVAGNIPVVGDWTGSGTAKIGVYRNGGWALDLNGNGQWDGCGVDACIGFGLPGDMPLAGKW